jgi:hypothetical protein
MQACFRCILLDNKGCCYRSPIIWQSTYRRRREALVAISPCESISSISERGAYFRVAVPHYKIDQLDSYAAEITDMFSMAIAVSESEPEVPVGRVRDHLKGVIDIRTVHLLIQDCVQSGRPEAIIRALRERLDVLTVRNKITLPPSME